jgi:hypothetical protein
MTDKPELEIGTEAEQGFRESTIARNDVAEGFESDPFSDPELAEEADEELDAALESALEAFSLTGRGLNDFERMVRARLTGFSLADRLEALTKQLAKLEASMAYVVSYVNTLALPVRDPLDLPDPPAGAADMFATLAEADREIAIATGLNRHNLNTSPGSTKPQFPECPPHMPMDAGVPHDTTLPEFENKLVSEDHRGPIHLDPEDPALGSQAVNQSDPIDCIHPNDCQFPRCLCGTEFAAMSDQITAKRSEAIRSTRGPYAIVHDHNDPIGMDRIETQAEPACTHTMGGSGGDGGAVGVTGRTSYDGSHPNLAGPIDFSPELLAKEARISGYDANTVAKSVRDAMDDNQAARGAEVRTMVRTAYEDLAGLPGSSATWLVLRKTHLDWLDQLLTTYNPDTQASPPTNAQPKAQAQPSIPIGFQAFADAIGTYWWDNHLSPSALLQPVDGMWRLSPRARDSLASHLMNTFTGAPNWPSPMVGDTPLNHASPLHEAIYELGRELEAHQANPQDEQDRTRAIAILMSPAAALSIALQACQRLNATLQANTDTWDRTLPPGPAVLSGYDVRAQAQLDAQQAHKALAAIQLTLAKDMTSPAFARAWGALTSLIHARHVLHTEDHIETLVIRLDAVRAMHKVLLAVRSLVLHNGNSSESSHG